VTVTEWNMAKFPAVDRQEQPLLIAAMASRQGWDALMHYAYAQVPLQEPGAASNWHAFNDPSRLAAMPAAALLYRQQHVRPSSVVYTWSPSPEEMFSAPSPQTQVAIRMAAEHGRLVTVTPVVPALPWLRPGAPPSGRQDVSTAPKPAASVGFIESDGGEVRRDWAQGVVTVSTARTQAAAGRLGGRTIDLPDVQLRLAGSRASVAVQSLDGRPVAESSDLLVSVAGPTRPSPADQLPFSGELVTGDIALRARPGLQTSLQPGVQVNYTDGRYVVHFDGKAAVHWVSLRRPARSGT
jgi:hypothetical protein